MPSKTKFNEIIILDLEMTCDENGQTIEDQEIIEIGGCFLNIKTHEISNCTS